MLIRLRSLLAPPLFPQDEEKTRRAALLNTLLLSALGIIVLEAVIAIPFFFDEKLINSLGALGMFVLFFLAHRLMHAGKVLLAGRIFMATLWIIFTLYMLFSGGTNNVLVVGYVIGTIIVGMLIGWAEAIIFSFASSLAGLVMALMEIAGNAPEVIFPIAPLVSWIDLTAALFMVVIVLNLFLRSLNEALALTRQRLEERRQAEEAVQRSEEKFRGLFETSRDFLYITDLDGNIREVNKTASEMSGYTIEELKRINIGQLYYDARQRKGLRSRLLSHGYIENYEIRGIKKDGTVLDTLVSATVIRNADGNAVGIQGSIKDITERRQTEESNARKTERLRALYSIEQAILSSMDLNMILTLLVREVVRQLHVDAVSVLMVNPQTQRLDFAAGEGFHTQALRYTRLEVGSGLAGLAAKELKTVHIPDLAMIENSVLAQSIFREKFISYYGVPLIAKDQLYGVMELFHRAPLATDPEWLAALETLAAQAAISIHNASLLEATQQSLKETNALYRISQSLVGSLDPDQLMKDVVELLHKDFGFYHVQIYQLNPANNAMVASYGSGELGDQLREEHYHLPMGMGIIGHVAETGEPFTTNNVDQVIFFIRNPLLPDTRSEMTIPIKIEGQVLGVLDIQQTYPNLLTDRQMQLMVAVSDQLAVALQKANLYGKLQSSLSQEKAMRSQLIQSERLALVGRLLASVSHELNNPIQAIQNALFLIKEEEPLSGQGRQDLEIVLAETERMAALIDRLRSTYRPAHTEDYQEVQLNELVNYVHALTATHMRHSGIRFKFQPDPALPTISGIPEQLRQVILNLFMNAIEAMRSGGQLTVQTEKLPRQKKVLLTFRDTGVGIDPLLLPHIFEPFITNKEKGTGLGLTITYDIIQQHYGEIRAENNPQGGATFKVWLPVKRKG
jgi:PAS domain S-box-containing protein